MRRLIVLSRVALLGLSAGVAYGDSAPVNPPEPVEVSPGVVLDSAPPKAAPGAGVKSAEVATVEPTVVCGSSAAASANTSAAGTPVLSVAPVATHLPDLNKPDPALTTRQTKSGYYVNTVRVLLPAGVKVTVRKDWYARDITVVYAKNPYTNWNGITPDALAFRHTGVVMEVIPSGTRYVPAELTLTVPSAVKVEVR